MVDTAIAAGVRALYDMRVQSLIVDPGGAVVGVLARQYGTEVTIRARRGVVLATGSFAYNASLIKLDACALYSPVKIASLVDPAVKGTKVALERHHLFPRAHLEETGIRELKKINQIANFAPVEWPENIRIGKKQPSAYVPPLDAAISAEKRTELYFWHALPHLWWEMPY